MEFTNLNFLSLIIFFLIWWIIFFLWYKNFLNQQKFNKNFFLLSKNKYFYIKNIFLVLSIFIILFSIFWIKFWDKKNHNSNKWIDEMFVLDVSKSMNVADIDDWNYAYKRLDLVKNSIANFVSSHREDRFWLVIFAWDAISTIPLTNDHDLFLTMLKWVDYRNLTKQWSDFWKALQLWVDRFIWNKNEEWERSKALIFISDWWDFDDEINKDEISQIAKSVKWISYFVVWVWTSKWWKIISGQDFFGRLTFQKFHWKVVISAINRNNLKNISDAIWWSYFNLSEISDLQKLNKNLNKLEKKVLERDVNWEKGDFGRNLAMLSFLMFLIYLFLYFFDENIFRSKNNFYN